ncbi:cupin domain-containing protein [Sphingomonas sp. RRHST34]|uniref:Cupin domain-containing protein n=1 Tax=Sphingomonas citri TaxID=2862499 RepID=A0ABS7BM14_9SPHN|nr:cupin domain-containing protein [Sphingomonas citri]
MLLAGVTASLLVAAPIDAQMQAKRLTPHEIAALPAMGSGAGTSGVTGIRSVVLAGDPTQAGLYTIEIQVPAHTRIASHTHRDDRTAVVVSGRWYIGYGPTATDAAASPLLPGSFYTEPAGAAHFAHTKDQTAAVIITGVGPTDTIYVEEADTPR